MGNFVTDPTTTLFPTKTTARPLNTAAGETTGNTLSAAEANALRDALYDVRTHTLGWVNVKEHGAVGDGATDDTVAIQAAATAAAGRTLRFDSNSTYKLSGRINLSSGTRVIGDGTVTLNQVTPGQIVFYGSGVSDVEVSGLTLTGAGSQYQPISGASNNGGAITFETSGGDIVVENNDISGFWNGITGTNLTGFVVRDNEVSHWRLYGVLASISSDFHIDDNRFHDNDMPTGTAWSGATTYALGQTATANAFLWMSLQNGNLNHAPPGAPPGDTWWLQIATYAAMATGSRPGTLQSQNTISNNKVLNNPVWDAFMSHDCDGLIISNNDARGVRNGVDISSSTAGKYVDKVIVIGNYFESTVVDAWSGAAAKNSGISLFGNDSTIRARNVVIADNVINGFNTFNAGTQANGGVTLSNTEGVAVNGNRIYGSGNFGGNVGGGVVANGVGNGVAISGNSIDGAAGLPPILLNALTADTVSVSGNTLKDANGTANAVKVTSSSAITELSLSGNSTNCTTPLNVVTGSTVTRFPSMDWTHWDTAAKFTDTLTSTAGGQGASVQTLICPSSGLSNIDLMTLDLSATASSAVAVEVEVLGIHSDASGMVKWVCTAYATRTAGADAVWTPSAATSMFVGSNAGGNPANALGAVYGALTAPKLIINQVSPSLGTLQFQPQVTFTGYLIKAKAVAWRAVVTPL